MARVLVVGAGLAGCTVAYTLAEREVEVVLVDKLVIGGKAILYGCKVVDGRCQNCGVCLTTGLERKVYFHRNINVFIDSEVTNISGIPGDYTAEIKQGVQGYAVLEGFSTQATQWDGSPWSGSPVFFDAINAIVVSTGFEGQPYGHIPSSHLHIDGTEGIITGTRLEYLMKERTGTGLFGTQGDGSPVCSIPNTGEPSPCVPRSVAFIQCLGSRDINEGGLYCSRVCCSYSTRAAKVIRSYYPECEIVFFYMELQNVESGNYYAGLRELGMEFIKCRPLKVTGGVPAVVEYVPQDSGGQGEISSREFDLVVLSDGIHAAADNDRLAEIYGLGQDKDGFLQAVGTDSGVYVAGCVRAPMKIDEAYADALTVAGKILMRLSCHCEQSEESFREVDIP